jgi:hypothetical protein
MKELPPALLWCNAVISTKETLSYFVLNSCFEVTSKKNIKA